MRRLRRVASCITPRPLRASRPRVIPLTGSVSFLPVDTPVVLRRATDHAPILLTARCGYRVERGEPPTEGYTLTVTAYSYQILDRSGRELLAFHWHPLGASPIRHPHLHLSNRIAPVPIEPVPATVALAEMHLPTGFVDLAAVVRLLITEFGVLPRRPDWPAILAAPPPAED